jgi:hypothetical protein
VGSTVIELLDAAAVAADVTAAAPDCRRVTGSAAQANGAAAGLPGGCGGRREFGDCRGVSCGGFRRLHRHDGRLDGLWGG